MIETDCSLKAFNSFSVEAKTHILFHFKTLSQIDQLLILIKQIRAENRPVLILGAGSNILFCEDFSGLIIKVELKGIEIIESECDYRLQVAAGENWHQLVKDCINKGINGLENLALIPGVVGAAPVQNIGAYGIEFKNFCESVEYINLSSGELFTLNAEQCQFSYRDSVFKHELKAEALIINVTIKLTKNWVANSRYGKLQNESSLTAKQIYQSVCQVRSEKLPDPEKLGNAGSFFKNPLVDKQLADPLQRKYPKMPHYPQPDGRVKLAAGWLIDQAGLKGRQVGGSSVHQQQALVLINKSNASAADIINLAELVRKTVKDKFNVTLEHEVRFIGAKGETNLQQVIKNVRS